MALTPSTMLALGSALPAFRLPVVSGGLSQTAAAEVLNSNELPARPLLVMLICAHCPFVKHVEPELSRLADDYSPAVTPTGRFQQQPHHTPAGWSRWFAPSGRATAVDFPLSAG